MMTVTHEAWCRDHEQLEDDEDGGWCAREVVVRDVRAVLVSDRFGVRLFVHEVGRLVYESEAFSPAQARELGTAWVSSSSVAPAVVTNVGPTLSG